MVVLSQLEAFNKDDATMVDIFIPVISAMSFLVVGGALAVCALPELLETFILRPLEKSGRGDRDWTSLAIMFCTYTILTTDATSKDQSKGSVSHCYLSALLLCHLHSRRSPNNLGSDYL